MKIEVTMAQLLCKIDQKYYKRHLVEEKERQDIYLQLKTIFLKVIDRCVQIKGFCFEPL
jgi:hypothetical protein